jgi:hypothetical protein
MGEIVPELGFCLNSTRHCPGNPVIWRVFHVEQLSGTFSGWRGAANSP